MASKPEVEDFGFAPSLRARFPHKEVDDYRADAPSATFKSPQLAPRHTAPFVPAISSLRGHPPRPAPRVCKGRHPKPFGPADGGGNSPPVVKDIAGR